MWALKLVVSLLRNRQCLMLRKNIFLESCLIRLLLLQRYPIPGDDSKHDILKELRCEKFSLNLSSSSFVIRVNLLHP